MLKGASETRKSLIRPLKITLQRHLIKYLVKALFSVREVGAVMALLHVSHQLQDLIRIKDFERQHDFQ